MKKLLACALVLSLGLPATAPLAAQKQGRGAERELAAMSEAQLRSGLGAALRAEAPACETTVLAAELERRVPEDIQLPNLVSWTAALCAVSEARLSDALPHLLRLNERGLGDSYFGLQIALGAQQPDALATFLRSAFLRDPLPEWDRAPDLIWAARDTLREQGRGDIFAALALETAAAGRIDALGSKIGGTVAIAALDRAVEQDRTLVPMLLEHIADPTSYIALLASRRYEPVWPLVEARVGPNLTRVTADFLNEARIARFDRPEEADTINTLAHALHYDARFEEAIAAVEEWRAVQPDDAAMEEGTAWAINIAALAHDALGQEDEADALFDVIGLLDPEQHSWVVNFAINRASRLVGQGRWEEGLAATELARRAAELGGSDYAKSLIARDRACALVELGRGEEADGELAFLREQAPTQANLAATALMCHGREEEAVGLVLAQLADEENRARLIEELQPAETELFHIRSILPQASDLLDRDERVRAAFLKHARPVPEQYYPAAALKR